MRKPSISARTAEHIAAMIALAFLATGLLIYALHEPIRITAAQDEIRLDEQDHAMTLYAQNCSVCHGLAGDGIGATPPLDSPDLKAADTQSLAKVIARGLYGTSMPAWSKEDGGPLSDYQINTLVTLIQFGDWEATKERVVSMGLAPLVPFTTEPNAALLDEVRTLPEGDMLAQGIELYARQCVACHGADGLGTALAPALNNPAVREKDPAEIERIILNGVAGTLMSAWQNTLTSDELTSLVTLISSWGTVPSGSIPEPSQPVPVTAESLELGTSLYSQSCSRCHGAEGQGTPRAPSLNVKGYLEETNDAALQQIITLGVPDTAMPAWGDRLTDAEIQAIVGFIRSWEPTAPEVATPARGGGPWWAVEGGTRQGRGAMLPSGGVQPTPTAQSLEILPMEVVGKTDPSIVLTSTVQLTSTTPTNHQPGSARGGQEHTAGTEVGGGPPWASQDVEDKPSLPDWRHILLFGSLASLILALLGSGLAGLNKLSNANLQTTTDQHTQIP